MFGIFSLVKILQLGLFFDFGFFFAGFGCGGGDYGKQAPKFGGASTAGVKVEPVAFLVVKDGVTRVMPVALPAVGTVDRVIDLVPQVMDRVESFIDKKKAEKETY